MFIPSRYPHPRFTCDTTPGQAIAPICHDVLTETSGHHGTKTNPEPWARAGVSLHEAIADFLLHLKASGRARNTILCYQGYLVRLGQFLGAREVATIFDAELERCVVNFGERDGGCSEVTLNKIKSVYRSFFRWVRETGRSGHDPAARISLAKVASAPTVPIRAEEVSALLAAIRNTQSVCAVRDEVLFATYAFTGIRRSEALSLRIADYDRAVRLLTLRRTKGGGCRVQPVPAFLAELLERYIHCIEHTTTADRSLFLFPGRRSQAPVSARLVQTRFDLWKSKACIRETLTIHSFRAGFATRLYRTTGDLWLVARALGHRNLYVTRRYVETDQSDIREAMDRAFGAGRFPAKLACIE